MDQLGKLPTIRRWNKLGTLRRPGKVPLPEGPAGEVETRQEELEKRAAQGVVGSLPERIILKWLTDRRLAFTFQYSILGGRRQRGGFILDFVVYGLAERPVVIRIQGEYWHGPLSPRGGMRKDDEQASLLRARGYLVCDLWESDIYRDALAGRLLQLVMRNIA